MHLSGQMMAALVPLMVLIAALSLYCLVDLVRAPSVRYMPKPIWALVIVFVSAPFGAILYLALGRERYGRRDQPADDQQAERDEREPLSA